MPDPRKTTVGAPHGADESGAFPEQDALYNNVVARSLTVVPSSPYSPNLPGAPSVPTPAGVLSGKLWDWGGRAFNVKAANAKGDSVTADAAAINATLTAAAGGTVDIPPGTYVCDAQIAAAIANTTIQFSGGAILKAKNSLNADLFLITASNVFVINGILDGNKLNNASGTGVTIDSPTAATLVSGVHLLNTVVQKTAGFGINLKCSGAGASLSGVGILDGCNVTDTNTGIFINGRVPAGGTVDLTTIRDCIVNTTLQHGIVSTGANRTIIDGCSGINVGLNKLSGFAHAFAIDGNGGTNPNGRHRLSNLWAINPADAGIEIADGITGASLIGCHVVGAGAGPNMTNNYGIFFGGALALSTQAEIIGCESVSSGGDNYRILGPDGAHLTDHVSLMGCVSLSPGANALTLTNVGTDVHAYGNPGFPATIQTTGNAIMTVTGDIVTNPSGAMRPFSDGLHNLGASGLRYKQLWLSQTAQVGKATPAYSASITPDASVGNWQTITVTNATAFTINAPTNPPGATSSQELVVEIFNNSGGVMGAITWNAAFILVGGAFTNPATTKRRFIRFGWNGTTWVETSRASADY